MVKMFAFAALGALVFFCCLVLGLLVNIDSSFGYQPQFAFSLTPKKHFHIFVVGDALKVCTWAAEGTGQVVSTPISCQRVHWLVDFFRAVFVDRKAVCKTFSSSSTVSGLVSFETDSR